MKKELLIEGCLLEKTREQCKDLCNKCGWNENEIERRKENIKNNGLNMVSKNNEIEIYGIKV